MNKRKTLWFRGAIVGAVICTSMFAAYFAAIPLMGWRVNDRYQQLTMLTGHGYVLFLGFIVNPVEYCGSPMNTTCIMIVGWLIFLSASAALIIIYMLIGALIGRIVEIALKRKAKQ